MITAIYIIATVLVAIGALFFLPDQNDDDNDRDNW